MRIDPEHDKYVAAAYIVLCALAFVLIVWLFNRDLFDAVTIVPPPI